MKYLKTFERYLFIDELRLNDLESELKLIEDEFKNLQYDNILDCIMELTDIGLKIDNYSLTYVFWKGGELQLKRIKSSSGEIFKYYKIDYKEKTIKYSNIESIDRYFTDKKNNLNLNLDSKRIFSNTIRSEVKDYFLEYKDWVPCLSIKEDKLIGWEFKDEIIDALIELKEKLSIYELEMIFLIDRIPTIVFVNKNYIKK